MSESPHVVILASAGTGKTWRLTHRLIALLATGVPPDRVLASTFTRKAAGEILQRLVARLVEAGTDDAELAAVNAQLAREPGAPQLDRVAARTLLLSVLRRVHRLDVRTLDALFHHLARTHGWELDLPPGWRIASETEGRALQTEAIGRVLRTTDRGAMLALLAALGEGAPRRSIHRELLQLVRQGHRAWVESAADAWSAVGHPPAPPAEAVTAARAFFIDLPADVAADLAGRRYWPDNLLKLRDALDREDWKKLLATGPLANVLEGKEKFDGVELSGPLGEALRVLVDQAVHVLLRRADERADAWRRLMEPFDAALLALQRERRLVRFEDVPRALRAAELPGGDDAHLAFRLDAAPDHVLLDEFQDTATAQWTVLRPLVERALAGVPPARSLFAVGDVKQSIFGWRDAEPRLLANLARRAEVRPEPLALSRRSAPAVMTVVNRVFGHLAGNSALLDDDVLRSAATAWSAGLQPHDTACIDQPGAVRLWELPASKHDDTAARARKLAVAAAQLVARLAEAEPAATIGVLVRRNAPIARLILELRRQGVLASGEGGNPLTDSDAVQLVLSLLVLADHPGDRAAAFHVATSPLGPLEGVDLDRPESWRLAATRVRRALLDDGLGAWLADVRDRLLDAARCEDRDRLRLGQLVDLGLAWEAQQTLRPGDFVAHVRDARVEEPAASRVRVLTVHAAKGLEFDAVVCPELEIQPKAGGGLMLDRPAAEGAIATVFPFVRRAIAARWPPAAALHAAVRQRAAIEDFSVLYVALTRARRRLDLLVTRGGGRGATFAKILRAALVAPEPAKPRRKAGAPAESPASVAPSEEPALLFAEVDPGADAPWLSENVAPRPRPGATETAKPADERAPPAARPALRWREGGTRARLRRLAPSSRESGGPTRAADLLVVGARDARIRGAVVHAWMESLGWLEDGTPDDAHQLDLARRLLMQQGDRVEDRVLAEWLAGWRAAIERDRMREQLSLVATRRRLAASVDARPDLWRERRFLLVDREGPDEVLVPGAFDRVVLFRDADGAPLSAEILDFKTDAVGTPDAPDAARLEERVAHYAPQMQAYRRALAALTGLARERIACRLLFLEVDVVREVDSAG